MPAIMLTLKKYRRNPALGYDHDDARHTSSSEIYDVL
jgi:hypothetical protein